MARSARAQYARTHAEMRIFRTRPNRSARSGWVVRRNHSFNVQPDVPDRIRRTRALFLDVRGAPVLALDAPHDRGLTVVRRPGPLPRLRRFSKRRQRSVRLLP